MQSSSGIIELLEHPFNKNIKFNYMSRAFLLKVSKDKKIKMKGLTKVLKDVFWPNYVYTRSRYTGGTGVRSASEGLQRGANVHKQLKDYTNLNEKKFKEKYHKLEDYTKKAICALEKWGLTPIRAELPIYAEEIKVATAIDLVCINKKKEIVLVEWKNGFDDTFLKGNAPIVRPEAVNKKFSNCPLHQAYFQLVFAKYVLKEFYGIDAPHCLVIQITQSDINPFFLPNELYQHSHEIFACMSDYMKSKVKVPKEKKEKKKKENTPTKRKKSDKSEAKPKKKSKKNNDVHS